MGDQAWAIGLDLGGQSYKLGLVDTQGRVQLRRQQTIDHSRPADLLVQDICQKLHELLSASAQAGLEPTCIGMVMPGYMDAHRTRLTFAANMPSLSGSDFLTRVRASMPVPVVFDSDANGAAYAEYRFGAGRGVDRLIVAVIGTGIGAGVIVGGRVLRIWNHIAGSLGHLIVDPHGERCACGGRGCLETHVSARAIQREAERFVVEQPASALAALSRERGRATAEEVHAALARGDPVARQIVERCGWWLGVAAASWCVLYRPERIVIGGGLAGFGQTLLDAARRGLSEVGQPNATRHVDFALAATGPDAGLIGAAALAMQEMRKSLRSERQRTGP